MQRLRTYPNGGWTYNCNTCSDPDTYVYPNGYGTVRHCGYFWSALATGAGSRANTIIHKGSHFTQVLGTEDYRWLILLLVLGAPSTTPTTTPSSPPMHE
ncbi:unnamed protein product [Rhizoctonia solani]|uniref:Lysine-specific metallo-endopeptidase domain-containing protein n=1 Tax=Rhizoctonia solani TaxID=456999 RepID=A0A8H3GHC6_9AGAM|nr:unnamed protein product [Rhizoctonia solani]